jgi:HEAT repeat protein
MPLVRKNAGEPHEDPRGAHLDDFDALTEGDTDQRWMTARALGDAPEEVEALGRALSRETDGRVREAIFNSLMRIGGARAVDAVLPYLRSDDAGLRTGALDALTVLAGAAAPRLVELLDDRDPDVRLLACEVVRELPAPQATAMICELLEDEEQVNVCGAAIECLAEIAGPEAIPVLTRCAARFAQEPFLLFAIGAAASRIGSVSAGTAV